MSEDRIKSRNHLYRLRRLRRLSQKHLAHLLGHKSVILSEAAARKFSEALAK